MCWLGRIEGQWTFTSNKAAKVRTCPSPLSHLRAVHRGVMRALACVEADT
jgi:hypothetical protein